jgi:hypothetical protein
VAAASAIGGRGGAMRGRGGRGMRRKYSLTNPTM